MSMTINQKNEPLRTRNSRVIQQVRTDREREREHITDMISNNIAT